MTTALSFRPGELVIEEDGSGYQVGSRCADCGAHYFPVREACAGCHGLNLETVPLSKRGVLYTFSLVRQSTPAFKVPYILGYVDLPEGVRVMAQIDVPEDEVAIGMELEMELAEWDTEAGTIGYRFRRAQ